MGRIHIGRFDFSAGDTLLIEADGDGVRVFRELLLRLAHGSEIRIELHRHGEVISHGGVTLVAEVSDEDVGVSERRRGDCVWRRSRRGWAEVAADVGTLVNVPSGHKYPDAPADAIQVIVATGEYGEEWWGRMA